MAQTIAVLMRHVPTQMARFIVHVIPVFSAMEPSAMVSSKSSPFLYI